MKKRIPAWLLLTLICVIAAGLLAATYNMTKPQIDANTAAKAEEARKALLPEATSFEYDEENNVYVAKNAAGEVIGYTATVPTNGFGGEIEITVGVEPDGTITGISVGGANFSETAGLGARAKEASFQDQFAGKTAPVSLSKDGGEIDALTAATITSKAVIRGVNDAMGTLSEVAGFIIETAQVDVEELGDGWYAISLAGFGGDVRVELLVNDEFFIGQIVADVSSETPNYGGRIGADYLAQYIGLTGQPALGEEVDALSGATITSTAINKAVNQILLYVTDPEAYAAQASAAAAALPDIENAKGERTSASAQGFAGPVKVEIAVTEDNTIEAIKIGDANFNETAGFGLKALEDDYQRQFIGKALPLNDGDVEAITGATFTSKAVVEAINAAFAVMNEELPDIESAAGTRVAASAQGFAGPVAVEIAVTADNTIEAIKIGDENFRETEGFGQKALADGYQRQFIGKALPLNEGDVDMISGATFTSKAVVEAINEAFASMSAAAPEAPEATTAPAAASGTVKGAARGFMGEVAVEVTIEDNAITALKIGNDEFKEIEGCGAKVLDEAYAQRYIGKTLPLTDADVEIIAGATCTSKAVAAAINNAYAPAEEAAAPEAEKNPVIIPAVGEKEAAPAAAVLNGSARGFMGEVAVEVTVANDAIAALKIGNDAFCETEGYGAKALDEAYAQSYVGKSLPLTDADVEIIAGATCTSKAVAAAINNAYAPAEEAAAPEAEKNPVIIPAVEAKEEAPVTAPEAPVADAPAAAEAAVLNGCARGFMGEVAVEVTVANDAITALKIGNAEFKETEGYGAKALDEAYAQSYVGKSLPLTDADVEIIAGATCTSKAVAAAINNAYAPAEEAAAPEAEKNPVIIPAVEAKEETAVTAPEATEEAAPAVTEEVVPATTEEAVVLNGCARGFMGEVAVEVTVANDAITALKIGSDAFCETEGYGAKALDEAYAQSYVGKALPLTDADVEIIAGATCTSKAVAAAINNAYAPAEEAAAPEAEKNPVIIPAVEAKEEAAVTAPEATEEAAPAVTEEVVPATTEEPVVLTGCARGFMGPVVVEVTVSGDAIAALKIGDADFCETEGYGAKALDEAFAQSYVGKSLPVTEVEMIAGATCTSNAVAEAINNAYAPAEEAPAPEAEKNPVIL